MATASAPTAPFKLRRRLPAQFEKRQSLDRIVDLKRRRLGGKSEPPAPGDQMMGGEDMALAADDEAIALRDRILAASALIPALFTGRGRADKGDAPGPGAPVLYYRLRHCLGACRFDGR